HKGFEVAMEEQRERARSARSDEKSMGVQTGLFAEVTEESVFIGYDKTRSTGKLTVIAGETALTDTAKAGETVRVIFDQTPFYAEMGGQVADTGVILNDSDEVV